MKTTQIQTDSLSSRNKWIWTLLLLIGGATYFIGFNLPATLSIRSAQQAKCPQDIYTSLGYECHEFDIIKSPILSMEIDNIKSTDQFLALQAVPVLKDGVQDQQITFEAETSMFALGPQRTIKRYFTRKAQRKVTFECSGLNHACTPETFAEISEVQDEHYIFIIKFINNNKVLESKVSDVRLAFVSFNPAFQDILSYMKWILFVTSIIGWFLYRRSLAPLSSSQRSGEQKFVGFMALLLILFNEPFIRYININRHMSYTIVVVLIMSAQTALLTVFWLLIIERLASTQDRASSTAKGFIKGLGFVHFIVSSLSYWLLANDQELNHMVDYQGDEDLFVVLSRYYLYGFLGFIALWTLIRLCHIVPKFGQLEWRDGTALTFAFCYVLCYAFFLYSGNLQAINLKGPRVIILYGITTLYTLLFEVIYAPSYAELEEAERARSYQTTEEKVEYGELDMSDHNNRSASKDSTGLRVNDANKNQKASVIVDDDDDI